MAKATKLPSGQWRVNAYSHTDADGKQHRVSFTAATKAEAEMLAAEFAATKKRKARTELTVGEAVKGYIDTKEAVLSPSTVRGYRGYIQYYEPIANLKIRRLTTADLQQYVSGLSRELSPKTTINIYRLLISAITMYDPDAHFKVTLPQRIKKRPQSPSDEAVRKLFEMANDKMKVCIALAACGLRRGEICALEYEDIENGIAHIHADMVKDAYGEWITKSTPKTSESDRFVRLPASVLELIGEGEGKVVSWTPDGITHRFVTLRDKAGLDLRFHDLRHYFASVGAVLGIPDLYLADMGGWTRGGSAMKSIYQNNITSMSDYYSGKMGDHIDGLFKGENMA